MLLQLFFVQVPQAPLLRIPQLSFMTSLLNVFDTMKFSEKRSQILQLMSAVFEYATSSADECLCVVEELHWFGIVLPHFDTCTFADRKRILHLVEKAAQTSVTCMKAVSAQTLRTYGTILTSGLVSSRLLISQHIVDLIARHRVHLASLHESSLLPSILSLLLDDPLHKWANLNPEEVPSCMVVVEEREEHVTGLDDWTVISYSYTSSLLRLLQAILYVISEDHGAFLAANGMEIVLSFILDPHLRYSLLHDLAVCERCVCVMYVLITLEMMCSVSLPTLPCPTLSIVQSSLSTWHVSFEIQSFRLNRL